MKKAQPNRGCSNYLGLELVYTCFWEVGSPVEDFFQFYHSFLDKLMKLFIFNTRK